MSPSSPSLCLSHTSLWMRSSLSLAGMELIWTYVMGFICVLLTSFPWVKSGYTSAVYPLSHTRHKSHTNTHISRIAQRWNHIHSCMSVHLLPLFRGRQRSERKKKEGNVDIARRVKERFTLSWPVAGNIPSDFCLLWRACQKATAHVWGDRIWFLLVHARRTWGTALNVWVTLYNKVSLVNIINALVNMNNTTVQH